MPDLDLTRRSRRTHRTARLLLLPLLLGACASTAPSPTPAEAAKDAAQAAEASTPAETPGGEEPAAQALLAKAVEGFGGADRIDGLRTLVVESIMTRTPAGGQETTIRQRSYVAFPDRFRREAILEQMTVASAVGPTGAFVISPLGILPLPEEERAAMMRGFARTPLSLLRDRGGDTFSASAAGDGEVDGQPVEYLEIVYDGDRHRLALDPETGEVLEIRLATRTPGAAEAEAAMETEPGPDAQTGNEPESEAETATEATPAAESETAAEPETGASAADDDTGEVVIRYADHREVDGLVYPFRSTTTSAGEPTVTRVVESLEVDVELDPELFEPPPAPPEGLLPPSAPEAPAEAPRSPDPAAPPTAPQTPEAADPDEEP